MTFGGALGLSVTSAQPYAGLSAKALAVLAGLYAALVHVASFGAGGYLAGRLRTPWVTQRHRVESHFRDGGHGFAVWALGVVLGAVFAVSGVGAVLKTAVGSRHRGRLGRRAGAAANPQTPAALQQLSIAADRLRRRSPAGALAPAPAGAAPADRPRVARRPRRADRARFRGQRDNPQLDARDRAWLASLVSQRTGLPQADAEKRVDEAFTELKAAEQKARDAADKARKATLIAAFLAAATHGDRLRGGLRRRSAGCPSSRRAHAGGAVRLAAVLVAQLSTIAHARLARPGVVMSRSAKAMSRHWRLPRACHL